MLLSDSRNTWLYAGIMKWVSCKSPFVLSAWGFLTSPVFPVKWTTISCIFYSITNNWIALPRNNSSVSRNAEKAPILEAIERVFSDFLA